MCGISGYISRDGVPAKDAQWFLKLMSDALVSRGPDSSGVWCSEDYRVGLAHRRLAILDLSPAGCQPMVSHNGRYVISFNGEIYNHQELRKILGCTTNEIIWRGCSDTEVLLMGIEIWGLEETLRRIVGMFSFALWDRAERVMYLARDRVGEKPLYYGYQQGFLIFGSELKALKAHPFFAGEIDRNAIMLQLRHSYIPAPFTIYKGIKKLPAGTFLRLPVLEGQYSTGDLPEPERYWSLERVINDGLEHPFEGNESEAIDVLDCLLRDTVRKQMVSDVPLGAFLSGGVDSSVIASLMQTQASHSVKTFSIGFNEVEYDEAPYARAIAQHLGTNHTELYVSAGQAIDVIPSIPSLYDEPFSDLSQIPTFLVSHMTRQHVTVSLSGDAGDELFGGYNRYLYAHRLWGYLSILPPSILRLTGTALIKISLKNGIKYSNQFRS